MTQPAQQQQPPGSTGKMNPTPDHGERSHRGSGRLTGKATIATGGSNAAYQMTRGSLEEIPDEGWDHTLATDPSAFFHLAKAAVPHMRPGSAIIATSSVNSDNPPLAPSEAGPPVLSMLKPMALEWEQIIVDAADPVALGRWWVEALGWVVVDETEEIIEIRPEPDRMPGLLFVPVPEGKTSKNRLHPDFRPDDQEAEVARLLSLGARRVDAVQDEQHWVTLLDPEGNEFCVLGERKS